MIGQRGETVLPTDVIAAAQREARIEPTDLVRQRVLTRLRQTVLAEAPLPPPPDVSARAGERGAPKEPGSATAAARAPAEAARAHFLGGWAAKGAVLVALAGGAGAGLHAWLRPAVSAPVSGEALIRPTEQRTGAPGADALAAPHTVQAAAASGAAAAPSAAAAEDAPKLVHAGAAGPEIGTRAAESLPRRRAVGSGGLAAERALLDEARRGLLHGQPGSALRALARHASSFSRGQLIEERESMWVKALVLAGRRPDAEARAASFRRRFPDSLFLPVIDAALRAPRP